MSEVKVKIDNRGALWIKRGSQTVKQYCKHSYHSTDHAIACGHWCPNFQGPVSNYNDEGCVIPDCGHIKVCDNTYWHYGKEEFVDERE